MSSFDVKMELEGKIYNVVNLNYGVSRDCDFSGRPASQLKGSFLDLDLEVPDGDVMFFKWLCLNEYHDGTIRFNKIDQESRHIEFKYEGAYCLQYKQIYASGPKSLIVAIRISSQKLTLTSGSEEFQQLFFPAV